MAGTENCLNFRPSHALNNGRAAILLSGRSASSRRAVSRRVGRCVVSDGRSPSLSSSLCRVVSCRVASRRVALVRRRRRHRGAPGRVGRSQSSRRLGWCRIGRRRRCVVPCRVSSGRSVGRCRCRRCRRCCVASCRVVLPPVALQRVGIWSCRAGRAVRRCSRRRRRIASRRVGWGRSVAVVASGRRRVG